MNLKHLLLAVWHLAPHHPDLKQPPEVLLATGLTLPALREVAIHLEILDPRETWLLAEWSAVERDLAELRRRYTELRDAPAAADADRLPARDTLHALVAANVAYQQHLKGVLQWWPWRAEIHEILKDTERRYQLYDLMREATSPYFYVVPRRLALARLRELMGPANYYAGLWPDHVPLDRFAVID